MPSTAENVELHKDLMVILQKIDSLCVKHDIKYSLLGGNLIGAVREKGFIPWDDDVDLSMMRIEWKRLKTVLCEDKDLILDEYSQQHPFIRMSVPGHITVCVDIFIYDYISENVVLQKMKILAETIMLGLMKTSQSIITTTTRGKYKGWRFAFIWILYMFGKLFSQETKGRWANYVYEFMFVGNKTLIQRANDQYQYLRCIFPKEVMGEFVRVPYEGVYLPIPVRYHEILTASYGNDYMKPKMMTENEHRAHELNRNGNGCRGV